MNWKHDHCLKPSSISIQPLQIAAFFDFESDAAHGTRDAKITLVPEWVPTLGSHQNGLIHRVLAGELQRIQRVVVEVENPPISHPK